MNETLKRSLSGAVYVILLLASILYSTESFFILFGIFLIIAINEFCNLVSIGKIVPLILGVLIYYINFYLVFNKITINYLDEIFLVLTLVVSFKCILFLFNDSLDKITSFSKYIFLIGYIIFPFIAITKITALGQYNSNSDYTLKTYSPVIILGMLLIIWTNDTFAYIVGKSIGKHKLYEKISPKKTIEGFLGGILFSVLAGFLISNYYINPKPTHLSKSILIWIITAVLISVFGTIGDLIESKFKRIAGVKDSGNVMPGHGGVLDRLDSVIFVAPIIFLFYQILNYVS